MPGIRLNGLVAVFFTMLKSEMKTELEPEEPSLLRSQYAARFTNEFSFGFRRHRYVAASVTPCSLLNGEASWWSRPDVLNAQNGRYLINYENQGDKLGRVDHH